MRVYNSLPLILLLNLPFYPFADLPSNQTDGALLLPRITNIFHYKGQTFISFEECSNIADERYKIYRSTSPLYTGKVDGVELVATLPKGSGRLLPMSIYKNGFQGIRHIVILEPGPKARELDDKEGGVVLTPHESGDFYYGVTVETSKGEVKRFVAGVNALREAISETPAPPHPVLIKKIPPSGYLFILYSDFLYHNRDACLKTFDGYYILFNIALPVDYRGGKIPLRVQLHGRGEAGRMVRGSSPQDKRVAILYPYDFGNTWWFGYSESIPITGPPPSGTSPAKGVIINHTEKKLEVLMEWVIDRERNDYFRVDRDRIYITGGSMGGTGALLFGLRHPDYFSGIHAFKCFFSMRWCHPYLETVRSLWGLPEEEFRTIEGDSVYDLLDLKRYITEDNAKSLPFLDLSVGRFDTEISFSSFPPFIETLEMARVGYSAHFDLTDHSSISSSRAKNSVWSTITLLPNFSKREPFPALSNASCNQDAGSGFEIIGYYDDMKDDRIIVKKGSWVVMDGGVHGFFNGFGQDLKQKRLVILVSEGQKDFPIVGNDEDEVFVEGGLSSVKKLTPFTRENSFIIFDGDAEGYYNSFIEWSSKSNDFDLTQRKDDIIDEEGRFAINLRLNTKEGFAIYKPEDPRAKCSVDVTIRGNKFKPRKGRKVRWKNIDFSNPLNPKWSSGEAVVLKDGEVTIKDFLVRKGGLGSRLVIEVEE